MYYVKWFSGKVWETAGNPTFPPSVRFPVTNHIPPILRLAATVLGGTLIAAPATAQGGSSDPSPVTIEYLANEGVLISHGPSAVLIDALMGDGLPGYPVVTGATRDSLERALGRFGSVDLVLVTHVHRDHFNARSVARHLRHNPSAIVAGAAQLSDSLADLAGWDDAARRLVVPATPGGRSETRIGAVGLEAHGIPHPPSRNQPVDHVVWVVKIGGIRLMHIGDSSPSSAELAAAAGDGVDVLLAPFWVLGGDRGVERMAATRASRVAAFHFGHDAGPFRGPAGVVVLRSPGQRFEVEPASR